jgi:hypothetical protein
MTWDDDKVSALYYDAVTNVDPSSATIVMDIDGTAYPMDWDGAATSETRWDSTRRESVTTWRRTAHTVTALAGASRHPRRRQHRPHRRHRTSASRASPSAAPSSPPRSSPSSARAAATP